MEHTEDLGISGEQLEELYFELMRAPVPTDPTVAIQRLGKIIDLSGELGRLEGMRYAIAECLELLDSSIGIQLKVILHYFVSNAWANVQRVTRTGKDFYVWEQPEIEEQIIHLRLAVVLMNELEGPRKGPDMIRTCQIYTNLGNLMSHCGRMPEALGYWDRALATNGRFAMAHGNRGYGLMKYAGVMHDPFHKALLYRAADTALSLALSKRLVRQMHPTPRQFFAEQRALLRAKVPKSVLRRPKPHRHDFFDRLTNAERRYREWTLRRRLFLNPLNEIQEDALSARDPLFLPTITTAINAGLPGILGFYSQLKQEYASARFCFYQGVTTDRPHFSDRDVVLVDTLDYPAYGFSSEQTRIAFRLAYSLFDKMAYLLNHYLRLSIPERTISFRSLWYVKQDKTRGLREDVHRPENTSLMALFWISKDLYERGEGFVNALEPDARELADLRNHLEHKYLKLHHFGPPSIEPEKPKEGTLGFSIGRSDFERRTERLLRLARSALIYLSAAIYFEEARRHAGKREEKGMELPLFVVRDDFKV